MRVRFVQRHMLNLPAARPSLNGDSSLSGKCPPRPSNSRAEDRARTVGNEIAHPAVPTSEQALLELCHEAKGDGHEYGGQERGGVTLTKWCQCHPLLTFTRSTRPGTSMRSTPPSDPSDYRAAMLAASRVNIWTMR